MARYRGTTAERGLGTPHRNDRERLLAAHRDGDPCWRCGQPMYKSQGLERDHVIDRARGGTDGPAVLAHMACNRAAGARLGNQMQPRTIMAAGHDIICATCGKPYHYAARSCEVCGIHYHPTGKTVRTCSRAHGVELRRRLYGGAGGRTGTAKPKPLCTMCGKPCKAAGNRFCSKTCAAAGKTATRQTPIAYYTCRYCGTLGVMNANRRQQREVCPADRCQLARLAANNLRVRRGLTADEANAQVTAAMTSGTVDGYGKWQASRQW